MTDLNDNNTWLYALGGAGALALLYAGYRAANKPRRFDAINAIYTLPGKDTDAYRTHVYEEDKWRDTIPWDRLPRNVRNAFREERSDLGPDSLFVLAWDGYVPLVDFERGGPEGWAGARALSYTAATLIKFNDDDQYRLGDMRTVAPGSWPPDWPRPRALKADAHLHGEYPGPGETRVEPGKVRQW